MGFFYKLTVGSQNKSAVDFIEGEDFRRGQGEKIAIGLIKNTCLLPVGQDNDICCNAGNTNRRIDDSPDSFWKKDIQKDNLPIQNQNVFCVIICGNLHVKITGYG